MRDPLAVAMVSLALGCNARADRFFDDFESYANTAAMTSLLAWGDQQDIGQPPAGQLMSIGGNQLLVHNGGETNRHRIDPMIASDTAPIIWEFDFHDDAGTPNRSITGGLRVHRSIQILEMGVFDANHNPETGLTVAGYAVRTVSIGGPTASNGWLCFPGNPQPIPGVHHFRAIIRPTTIVFELDLNDDGSVDATRTVATTHTGVGGLAVGWDSLRIGGPSDLGSPSGEGGGFDNVSITRCLCERDDTGSVNVFDLLAYLDLWFSGDAAADLLTGGISPGVDVFDLLVFLDCWFPASAGEGCP